MNSSKNKLNSEIILIFYFTQTHAYNGYLTSLCFFFLNYFFMLLFLLNFVKWCQKVGKLMFNVLLLLLLLYIIF